MCDVLEVPLCLGRCPCDSSALAPPAVSVCPAPPIVTSWRPHALVEVWNKSNFIHIYVWSFNVLLIKIDQADRLKKQTNKQTNKHKSRLKTSKQVYSLWYSPVHYISTWRSCNCMSIAFSRLFLLSRLMVTWLPWTSRRFCLSTSSSLLREMGLVVAGSAHIWWDLTWSCLFSPRRALFGKQDLSKTGWRCNKGESCCCDMLRYVIIIKHEICRIFYYSGFSHLELVEFSSALVCLITDLPTVSSRGSRIWEASRGWKIFMVFTFSRWSRPNPRSLGWRYSRMIKAGSPMAGPDDPRLRSSSVMLSKSEDFHIIWMSKTQENICNASHGGLIWLGS